MATIDPSHPQQQAASPVESDRPEISFIALIGAALITVSAMLTAIAIALGQQ